MLKYRHAYEFLSQIIAYADADVSRRAMLCSVLEPNLHVTEDVEDEDFLTGVTLAGVAIAQGDVEEDHSVTDGEAAPLKVPEFTVCLGEPHSPLRTAFDEVRLPSSSGHPICADLVSVGEDVHCESTAQKVHA